MFVVILKEKGNKKLIKEKEISTPGTIDSFLKGKHFKPSCYPCQFGLTGLASLLRDAAHQLWRMEKRNTSVICNCNLLVYDNRDGNKIVHVCEEYAFGWLWFICVLLRILTYLGLRSRSCKLHQMAVSFGARFKVNFKSKKRISWVLQGSFYCPKDGTSVFQHGRRSGA